HVMSQYRNIIAELGSEVLDIIAAQPHVISLPPYIEPKLRDERQGQIVAGNLTNGLPTGPGYLTWLNSMGFSQEQFDASGFVVNVSDSGIDNGSTAPSHFGLYPTGDTSLASRVVYNRLEGTPNSGSTLAGCDGHGTINAHIIGGYNNLTGFPHADNEGYRFGLGIAPYVKIGSSVIFDPNGFTFPNYSDLISRAYEDGARISSDSWGADTFGGYDINAQEYDALVRDAQPSDAAEPAAGNQEMTIIFAAGNSGPIAGTIGSPGTAKNVITVGASENVQSHAIAQGGSSATGDDGCATPDSEANNANDIAPFSARGPCEDDRKKPELVAPGTHITGGVAQQSPRPSITSTGAARACFTASGVCALPGGGTAGDEENFFPLGQQFYTTSSGTSHATPAVAGGAALLRQYFINQGRNAPSPAMVKACLINAARYMTGVSANDSLWSNSQGMGSLSLEAAFDGVPRILRDQRSIDTFTASGQSRSLSGQVADNTKPVRITLAWTDAPGSTLGVASKNDLDLVVSINGEVYLGNVFSGGLSVPGGDRDSLNNTESVFLPAGTSGSLLIHVSAANINSDGVPNQSPSIDQDFALVVYNINEIETPVLAIDSTAIVGESCGLGNQVVDAGETISMEISLRNVGTAAASNVVATLLETNGVILASGPQAYGAMPPLGSAVTNQFSFTANVPCGDRITLSFALADGTNALGTVSRTYRAGSLSVSATEETNPGTLIINDDAIATPYPSTITVTNLGDQLSKVTVTLHSFSHTWPEDVDVLLVGPEGQSVVLMSAVGDNNDVIGVDLTFDDESPFTLPIGSTFGSGSYRPTDAYGVA
ncbi:MAG: S8 family serine peptidase, partial [Kiritimatiellae bacterium]|nr:S8 family serine peptidase [Kiritimatiellia bacterium]